MNVVVGGADEGKDVFDRILTEHSDSGVSEAHLVEDGVDRRPRLVQAR